MSMTDVADNAAPDDDESEQTKLSQQDANYRRGTPMQHCGVCVYYEGDETQSCSRVEGPISGFGLSDVFTMQKNPFPGGPRIGPQEAQVINSMMNSPPDRSGAVASQPQPAGAAPVQIGNRSYRGAP